MSDPDRPASWVGDAGARRLFTHVRSACAEHDRLPARLEAGLRAALDLLAEEPDLARLLTVDPYLGDDQVALAAQREWIGRFARLLREAVADDPRTTPSDLRFLGEFLIGGVRFQIARRVLKGESAELPRLLPGLLEGLLAYYFDPGEPPRLARAALDGHCAA
ncbi:MAG: hypothetical protein JST08_01300 [Actinobacteria bacterium]|nr:hypothetical protein [Actinomycetota bacterium]